MYEFTKKTVEEDVNVMVLFSENSEKGCTNNGICGDPNALCGA